MPHPCLDCSRACPSRQEGFCRVSQPGRVAWMGTTYAEEHEIAPTFEIFLTGCSLACSFCSMTEVVRDPAAAARPKIEDLLERLVSPTTPPFRTIAFVGGEPTVNLPFLRRIVPVLRQRLPGTGLVLNTNLYFHPRDADWYARTFDLVLGDLHFGSPDCARDVAEAEAYPVVSFENAERLLSSGARLLVRLLVLPGHLDCCAAPVAAFIQSLARHPRAAGRFWARVHTGYAPVGRAARDPKLGRHLSEDEMRRALSLLGPLVPAPSRVPLPGFPCRPPEAKDAATWIDVDASGRIFVPFVTGDVLPLAAEWDPSLGAALAYLGAGGAGFHEGPQAG
jgi:putative pyruvate formate lyase activating enzyme